MTQMFFLTSGREGGNLYSPLESISLKEAQDRQLECHLERSLAPIQWESRWYAFVTGLQTYLDRSAPEHAFLMYPEYAYLAGDVWGQHYPRWRWSMPAGLLSGLAAILLVLAASARVTVFEEASQTDTLESVVLIAPVTKPRPLPLYARSGRGIDGGGGGNDPLPASRGRLPRWAEQQIVPPTTHLPEEPPALPVEPTLLSVPNIVSDMTVFGDPAMPNRPSSDGPGQNGGIGNGRGGGIGSGRGPTYGAANGSTGGIVAGGGVIPPRATRRTSPQYTAEAYSAKVEGKVVLLVAVLSNGQARVVRVVHGLPMGLTEKAVEAVESWTFEPGQRNGQPIAMEAEVTVFFRL